ncbi:MAG TPA: glycosyltransferase 87 family protein [Solirubrobacteraceae bacterium]|nr:glycosyltransferase 87 family protein [Solirubrobacteraceae bacterium]
MTGVLAQVDPRSALSLGRAALLRRIGYVALLAAAPLLPSFGNSYWHYPEVSNFWVFAPLAALFLVALADLRHPLSLLNLDLLALLCPALALCCWRRSPALALVFLYPALLYLGVRMTLAARAGHAAAGAPAEDADRLPRSWLAVGVAVLVLVQASWTLGGQARTDVGVAGVFGAHRLLHGEPVYGIDHAQVAALGSDPHYDTYGPVVYEAYAPFVAVFGGDAARWAAFCFTLATAALLFALGHRLRGPTAGVTLAYAWLAFPLTLYTGQLADNDALVAASLVAVLLFARSPARRGLAAALAAWTKLSPLALVPLLLAHAPEPCARRRGAAVFTAAFALASFLALAPAMLHSSPGTFLARTFGFQLGRPPAFSVWEELDYLAAGGARWLKPLSAVVHGLLIASVATLALALARTRAGRDLAGLAAACAAVLIGLAICDGYFSLTYVLWFAPLALAATVLGRERAAPAGTEAASSAAAQAAPAAPQSITVSSRGRPVSVS